MKPRREVETCSVVDPFCTSPANLEPPVPARGRCYWCGVAVCGMCSSRRLCPPHVGARRICNDCQIHELDGGSDAVVMRRMHRLARNS